MSKRRVINDRVATKAESEAGEVIFYIPDQRSTPYSFGGKLPITVVVTKPNLGADFPAAGTILEIVQAELVDGKDVVLGFINGNDEGICTLEDVQVRYSSDIVQ